MNIFSRLFGNRPVPPTSGLVPTSGEAAPALDELPEDLVRKLSERLNAAFADAPEVRVGHGLIKSSVNIPAASAVVDAIDNELTRHPDDVALMLAKSSALRIIMQMETAEEVIDEILLCQPDQFDARRIKHDWDTWPHLLQRPACWVGMTTLSPALKQAVSSGSVLLVRDGISLGVALIQDVSTFQFARELTPDMRCKWEFICSDTPHGRIVAHYSFVEDAPKCSYLQESMIQTGRPAKADGVSGYWLLQRLARMTSSLLVLVKGDRVVYSNRYVFPESTRAKLRTISEVIAADPRPTRTPEDFRAAVKWHVDHLDNTSIVF